MGDKPGVQKQGCKKVDEIVWLDIKIKCRKFVPTQEKLEVENTNLCENSGV